MIISIKAEKTVPLGKPSFLHTTIDESLHTSP